jgi:hypothetical protein
MLAALSSGVPLAGDWPNGHARLRDWADVAARAIESDDEHVIKLVYSAFAESQRYSNPLYLFVARETSGVG